MALDLFGKKFLDVASKVYKASLATELNKMGAYIDYRSNFFASIASRETPRKVGIYVGFPSCRRCPDLLCGSNGAGRFENRYSLQFEMPCGEERVSSLLRNRLIFLSSSDPLP
jgi:hypothetical protein